MARPHASNATAGRNRFSSRCFDRAPHATHNGQTRKSEVGVVPSAVGSRQSAVRGDDADDFRVCSAACWR